MIGPWLVVGLAVAAAVAGGYGLWVARSRRRRPADPVAASLRRAEQAVARLREQTRAPKDPTLRAQLDDVDDKAAEVLADLHRYAAQLPAIDESLRDIPVERLRAELASLEERLNAADDPTLRTELQHAERSLTDQLAVAGRLETARGTLLARIEAAVLDLEGLGHRVAEIIVMHDAAGEDAQTGTKLTELSDDVSSMRSGLAEAQDISSSVLGAAPPPPAAAKPRRIIQRRKGKPRWDIVAGVVAVVLIASCLVNAFVPHGNPFAGTGCVEAIGFLGRLSGDDAGDAQTEFDAAALAVEQDNAAHPACRVQLQKYDTNIGDDGAQNAATAVVEDAGVLGVVGPTYGSDTEGALPVLGPAGVAMITPSASDSDLPGLGWDVFHRTLPSDDDQADAAARYLKGRKTFVIGDDTGFGEDVAAHLAGELKPVGRATVTSEQKDFAGVAKQVAASGADAVYFAGVGGDGGLFVKAMRAESRTITIVGGDRLITTSFFDGAGDAAEGTVATCPCVPTKVGVAAFRAQFLARYGTEPGFYAPEAYDAAQVLLTGIRAGRTTRADLLAWVDGYDADGISRHLRFGTGGGIAVPQPNVWAYTVTDGSFTPDNVL